MWCLLLVAQPSKLEQCVRSRGTVPVHWTSPPTDCAGVSHRLSGELASYCFPSNWGLFRTIQNCVDPVARYIAARVSPRYVGGGGLHQLCVMRFVCAVDRDTTGTVLDNVKVVSDLTTANWPMFAHCGYDAADMAEVIATNFVARGVAPVLGALSRPVPRTYKSMYKEPARVICAASTTMGSGAVATRDLFPACPDGPFLPAVVEGVAARNRLRELLSRTGWWRHTIITGHNQSAAKAWIEEHFRSCAVKVLGETNVKRTKGQDPKPLELARVSISGQEAVWVSIDLLAHLCAVRLFRSFTEGLLASLRGRSRLWAESEGVAVADLVQFLPGTLTLACLPSHGEVVAMRAFRGVGFQWSADVLGSFARGVVKEPDAPWLRWRDVLRGWTGGGLAGAFERPVQSLILPS